MSDAVSGIMSVVADHRPLVTPGRIEPIDPSDRIVTAGVVTSGTLTFEDSASGGPRSLASLGGVGGTTGTTDDALLRANGAGGSTAQGSTVTLSDIGFLNNVTQLGIYSNTTVNALQALGGAHTVNGYSRAKFLQIVSSMNAILEGSPYSAIDIEVSSSTATGAASISAISVQHNGTLVKANALALAGNMGAIRATAGARVDATQILVDPSAIDRTALLSTGGAGNVAAWQSTTDKVQIGHSAPFSAVTLTFLVQPVAGGLGLTFEYSTGVGTWLSFTAFTIDSIYYTINWPIDELTGWAVGSGGRYWIRFTRTNADAALNSTSLNAVRLMLGGTFYWDEQGRTLQASVQLAKLAANPAVIPSNALWLSSADGRMRQGVNVLAYLSEIGGGGSGDVVGPASATDNAVARFDLTTGKLIQNSVVAISDAGAVTGVTTLSASGAVTALNVSGTNTGDQTITLTGDVTGSGTGSFAATIANDAVTYAKMQNVSAASRIIGRGSAGGSGDPEELTIGSGLSLSGTALSATTTLTGDVTGTGSGSFATTIANDAVTYAKIQNVSAADRLLGRGNGGGSGDVQEITLGTNLSLSGTTLNATSGSPSYTVISPTSIGANQNNYAPTGWSTADIVRLTGAGNFDITGFDATATTVRKLLWNVDTADTFTLKHESGSSTAANRLVCPYDQDLKLNPDAAIVIHYDSTTARWRAVSDERRPPMLLSQARRTSGALISGTSFIGWDSEVYSTLAEYLTFDSAGTWTVQKSCTLLLRATMTWQAATSGVGSLVIDFRKNASTVLQEQRSSAEQATDNYTTQTIEVAHDFVASDTIRLYATNFGGSPTTTANMMIMSIFHVKG